MLSNFFPLRLIQKATGRGGAKRHERNQRPRRPGNETALSAEQMEPRRCPAGLFSFEAVAMNVQEGEAAIFRIRLSASSTVTERVLISTVAETARLGIDYMQAPTQILFSPGETVKEYRIMTLRESPAITEGIETFRVIATPYGRPTTQIMSARVSIRDFVAEAISVQDVTLSEGTGATSLAAFVITLSSRSTRAVTINYATRDGTATAASGDYVAASGTVRFAAGEITKTVSITVNGDTILESNETFFLDLSNPSRGATLLTPTATATILNDDRDLAGFQITLTYNGIVPQSVRNAAVAAAARWQQIITGDLPGVTVGGVFIDDITISVEMGLLGNPAGTDGPGGTLANANFTPGAVRAGVNGLPYFGRVGIDPQDVGNGQLAALLAHEFVHPLGFPDSAGFQRYVFGNYFTGPNALREYRTLSGLSVATGVPLEPGADPGHWDDNVFGPELITTYMSPGFMPISRITVGALQDMGYSVNYARADPYTLPVAAPAAVQLRSSALAPAALWSKTGPIATSTQNRSSSGSTAAAAKHSAALASGIGSHAQPVQMTVVVGRTSGLRAVNRATQNAPLDNLYLFSPAVTRSSPSKLFSLASRM